MTTKVNITDLEEDVLLNGLYASEYNEVTVGSLESWGTEYGSRGNVICVWSDCIEYNCEQVGKNQISGVLSSLSKKGLVICEGETVEVTKEGWEAITSLLSSPEEPVEEEERVDEKEVIDSYDLSAPGRKLEELQEGTKGLKDELAQMEEEMNKPNPERDAFYRGYEEGYDTGLKEKNAMRDRILDILKRKGLIPEFSDAIGDLEMLPDKKYVIPEEE